MTITGRCIDDIKPLEPDNERGIPDVLVTLSNDKLKKETRTDKLGNFSFAELEEGTYELKVSKEEIPCYAFYEESMIVNQESKIELTGYCVT
jgi:hypothetical protein